MSNRAAIYARYSSDNQRDASIDDQVRSCRARAVREGLEVVGVHADHATSGTVGDRPGWLAVLASARRGEIDVLLTEALDRLSRDQEHIAGFFKQLSFNGVRIISLSEGEISELHVGLKGTMNALFLKDLAIKTHRGIEGRVRAGRSGGGLSYGYRVVRKLDAVGEAVTGEREIDDAQAAIIRRIFDEYAQGLSPRAIALRLNREGIPGPRDGKWTASLILGNAARETGILRNRLYAGELVWNRQRFVKDPTTGKRVARVNPKSAWITEPVPSLSLVESALWEEAQRQLLSRRTTVLSNERALAGRLTASIGAEGGARLASVRRPVWLLSGLVRCGLCGGTMTVIGADGRLGCANRRERGVCGNRRSILRDKLTKLVLSGLKHRLLTPALVDAFARSFVEEANARRAVQDKAQAASQQDIARITRQISNLLDLMREGGGTKSLVAELRALEERQDALERARSAPAVEGTLPAPHPDLASVYRRKVEHLEQALEEPQAAAAAAGALRLMIDAIIVHPGPKRGELRLELRGDLAAFIDAPDRPDPPNGGNPPRGGGYEHRLCRGTNRTAMKTLVAGARFHLHRTRFVWLRGRRSSPVSPPSYGAPGEQTRVVRLSTGVG